MADTEDTTRNESHAAAEGARLSLPDIDAGATATDLFDAISRRTAQIQGIAHVVSHAEEDASGALWAVRDICDQIDLISRAMLDNYRVVFEQAEKFQKIKSSLSELHAGEEATHV